MNSPTPVSPDELGIENEAICEKLLGWNRSSIVGYWFPSQEHAGTVRTPSFTTWAEAGLILEALKNVVGWEPARARSQLGWLLKTGELTPLAVRAEALEYIRRQS